MPLYPRMWWWEQIINSLNAELNPIRHLLALAGAHHFVDVSRIRVKPRTIFFGIMTRKKSKRDVSGDFD
jgi:hypothetical protein